MDMTQPSELCAFFDTLPQPVLLLRGGTVVYSNPAAVRALPLPEPGSALPEFLAELADARGAVSASCLAGGRLWSVAASYSQQGLLVFFQNGGAAPGPGFQLPVLVEQMRQHVGNLVAATHLLTPVIREHGEARYDQYLAIMNQSFYRLMRLMNSADTARDLDNGALPFRPASLDLAGLCRELADQVTHLAGMAGVSFRYESELSSLLTTGDAALLRRLILSLVSNALRAAGRGGEAGLRLAKPGRRALITVWDSGPGLGSGMESGGPDSEPIYRSGGGLGVGLSAARQIAALHGGAVMLESRSGKGVRAAISLPVQPPEGCGTLRTPSPVGDVTGGFSPVLVELADLLPSEAFLPDDVD